jgi:hypothetical protein
MMTKPENETPQFWFKRVEEVEARLREAEEELVQANGAASHAKLLSVKFAGDPALDTAASAARTNVDLFKGTLLLARQELLAAENRDLAAQGDLLKEEAQGHVATLVDAAKKLEEIILEFTHAYRTMKQAGGELIRSAKKASQIYPQDQRRDGRVMTGEWIEVLAQNEHTKRRVEIELRRQMGDLWPVDFEVPMAALHTPFSTVAAGTAERALTEIAIYLDAKA